MATDREFAFGSFRFDARSGQLWREKSQVKLTPRAAAVLCHLAERAQELVKKLQATAVIEEIAAEEGTEEGEISVFNA